MYGNVRGNVKLITGAGKYGGYRGDILSAAQAEKVARGMSGGRIGAEAITFEGYKDHILTNLKPGVMKQANPKTKSKLPTPKGRIKPTIKSWEDRNVSNRGSKLNP